MGEKNHVVEIIGEEEKTMTAIEHHPLTEISNSPGHLLLLKLWQREDLLFLRRISINETRLHSLNREVSHLCTSFLLFHGLFLTLLFTGSVQKRKEDYYIWWVPSLSSLATSLVIVFLVQAKLRLYWKAERKLQKEKTNNRAVLRMGQELRMKGAAFDLNAAFSCCSTSTKRMKSSSVEIKWRPVAWCKNYAPTIFLVAFTALVFPASNLILRLS